MSSVNAATVNDFVRLLVEEIDYFISAQDKRGYVIARCLELFDEYFAPVDLPGPDAVIDPLLRAAIGPVVGRIYDEILKKLKG